MPLIQGIMTMWILGMGRVSIYLTIGSIAAVTFLPNLASAEDSIINDVWNHNGSVVSIIENPNSHKITISYIAPKSLLRQIGIIPSTILFTGQRVGAKVSGMARTFKYGCEPATYNVSGIVSVDDSRIELRGASPIRETGPGCDIVAFRNQQSLLLFTKEMQPATTAVARIQSSKPIPSSASSTGTTVSLNTPAAGTPPGALLIQPSKPTSSAAVTRSDEPSQQSQGDTIPIVVASATGVPTSELTSGSRGGDDAGNNDYKQVRNDANQLETEETSHQNQSRQTALAAPPILDTFRPDQIGNHQRENEVTIVHPENGGTVITVGYALMRAAATFWDGLPLFIRFAGLMAIVAVCANSFVVWRMLRLRNDDAGLR